jgi:hypothetical protein
VHFKTKSNKDKEKELEKTSQADVQLFDAKHQIHFLIHIVSTPFFYHHQRAPQARALIRPLNSCILLPDHATYSLGSAELKCIPPDTG